MRYAMRADTDPDACLTRIKGEALEAGAEHFRNELGSRGKGQALPFAFHRVAGFLTIAATFRLRTCCRIDDVRCDCKSIRSTDRGFINDSDPPDAAVEQHRIHDIRHIASRHICLRGRRLKCHVDSPLR